ncbi:hypothetical protein [Nitrosospira sp. Nsp11]|nr:hypothetical protein [Nitrosospira sp. Nsp11]
MRRRVLFTGLAGPLQGTLLPEGWRDECRGKAGGHAANKLAP